MKKAQADGIAFSSVLKLATQAYIKGGLGVGLFVNDKTRNEIGKALKDIKAGKNLSPILQGSKKALDYLK